MLWNRTWTLRYSFSIVLFVLAFVQTTFAAAPSVDDIHAKLEFAKQTRFATGRFAGSVVNRKDANAHTTRAATQRASDFRRKLEQKANDGALDLGPVAKQEFVKRFGTADYRGLMNEPYVRQLVQSRIEEAVAANEKAQGLLNSPGPRTESRTYYLGKPGYVRCETSRLMTHSIGMGQSEVRLVEVVRPEYWRCVTVDGAAETLLYPGGELSELRVMEPHNLRRAGLVHPWVGGIYRKQDIQSVKVVGTPEGQGVRVVYSRDLDGSQFTYVVTVLPDKGYSVCDAYSFSGETLNWSMQFGRYRRVEPGVWYPMRQERWDGVASVPEKLLTPLREGKSEPDSPGVQGEIEVMRGTRSVLELTDVALEVNFPDSAFEIAIPLGHQVLDHTQLDKAGRPLRYVNGPHDTPGDEGRAIGELDRPATKGERR